MKPIVLPIKPFDRNLGTVIHFRWNGKQINSSTITITDIEQNKVVHSNTYTSFQNIHILKGSSNNLINGKVYSLTLKVTTIDNEISEPSTSVNFKCLSTPKFNFSNIQNDIIVENSELNLSLNYFQLENEKLNVWKIYLYDNSKTELYSKSMSAVDGLFSNISGLVDRTSYYLRATGETVLGMNVDTGYVKIYVTYNKKSNFSDLELTNQPDKGLIHIKTNFTNIDGDVFLLREPWANRKKDRKLNNKEISLLFGTENQDNFIALNGSTLLEYQKGFNTGKGFLRLFVKFKVNAMTEKGIILVLQDKLDNICYCTLRKTKVNKDSLGNKVSRTEFQVLLFIEDSQRLLLNTYYSNYLESVNIGDWLILKIQREDNSAFSLKLMKG